MVSKTRRIGLAMIFFVLTAALTSFGLFGETARALDTALPTEDQGAETDSTGGACDRTTQAAAKACDFNAQNDFWKAVGTCDNLADASKKAACKQKAQADLQSAKSDCQKQTKARQRLCQALGQAPYDPKIDPQNFVKTPIPFFRSNQAPYSYTT